MELLSTRVPQHEPSALHPPQLGSLLFIWCSHTIPKYCYRRWIPSKCRSSRATSSFSTSASVELEKTQAVSLLSNLHCSHTFFQASSHGVSSPFAHSFGQKMAPLLACFALTPGDSTNTGRCHEGENPKQEGLQHIEQQHRVPAHSILRSTQSLPLLSAGVCCSASGSTGTGCCTAPRTP